ncbi:N-acetyltransferase domain-containing protein [Bordetella tumbae]|uniref:GNAT family N-acetyltransferase n=1 Tax=Bordetella tumbae TaxID=1649139 RepID=UPI0039F0D90D
MSKITIRPAVSADVLKIQNIVKDAYSVYIERIGREPAPMTDDYTVHVKAKRVWVLDTAEGLAGLMVLRMEADHLLVSNVAVERGSQGKGFGRRLLDFADEFATQNGKSELRLYTNELMRENLAIYQKLGWEEYRRAEQDGFRRVFMCKKLRRSGG